MYYGLGVRSESDYAITSSDGPILEWSLTASTHPRELAAATEPETVADAVHLTWGDLFLYPD